LHNLYVCIYIILIISVITMIEFSNVFLDHIKFFSVGHRDTLVRQSGAYFGYRCIILPPTSTFRKLAHLPLTPIPWVWFEFHSTGLWVFTVAVRGLDDGTIAPPTKINLMMKINCIILFLILHFKKNIFLLKCKFLNSEIVINYNKFVVCEY